MKVVDVLTGSGRGVEPKGFLSRTGNIVQLKFSVLDGVINKNSVVVSVRKIKEKIYTFVFKDCDVAGCFYERLRVFLTKGSD